MRSTRIYHEFIRGNARPYSSRSLRQGDWKAVQIAKGKKQGGGFSAIELYNLKEDLGETKNLAKQYPEIVDKMERFMDEAHTPLK
jgi:arylsulfatase A-like enzyme